MTNIVVVAICPDGNPGFPPTAPPVQKVLQLYASSGLRDIFSKFGDIFPKIILINATRVSVIITKSRSHNHQLSLSLKNIIIGLINTNKKVKEIASASIYI
jgi:hypothetical protein